MLSYLFRRSVIGLSTSILQGVFRYLHRQVEDNVKRYGLKDSLNYALIVTKQNTRAYFPTNEEFYGSLHTRNLYGKFRYTKYLLMSLENNDNKTLLDSEEITIEHIMPQKISKSWRETLGDDWKQLHEENVNDLGNLTLTSYNSDMSNFNFSKKKEILTKERHIKLNDTLLDIEEWNIAAIENRGMKLAKNALTIWQYPEINSEMEQQVKEQKYNSTTLYEIIQDYISIKPVSIEIDKQVINVKTYRDILQAVIIFASSENEQLFEINFVDNEEYTRKLKGEVHYLFSKDESKVFRPKKAQNYYFDSNNSGYRLCSFSSSILKMYNIDPNSVIIKYYK